MRVLGAKAFCWVVGANKGDTGLSKRFLGDPRHSDRDPPAGSLGSYKQPYARWIYICHPRPDLLF